MQTRFGACARSMGMCLLVLAVCLPVTSVAQEDGNAPVVNEPASPDPQSTPGQADQVFVTSGSDNRSVYVINKNSQAIDVLLHCESSSGWENNYAMVGPNSHQLLCDDVVNDSVYFWARSEDGACTWDGKDTDDAKSLLHPVDEVEYETLMYDIALESKIVGIPVSGCNS